MTLSGCVGTNNLSTYDKLIKVIETQTDTQNTSRNNNFSEYVSYYLPSDMSEIDSDFTTFTFRYNDSIILYNINIADLINNKYYPEEILKGKDYFYDKDYLLLSQTGNIETSNGNRDYLVEVYEIENEYLISFSDLDSQIYAYSTKGDVVQVLRHIFILARFANVDEEKVITNFSDKDVISSTRKTIGLFNYVYPSSGYLSDLINSPSDTNQEQTINTEEEYDEEVPEEDFEESLEDDE